MCTTHRIRQRSIWGWVPPELSFSAEHEITHILPLRRDHELALTEKYTVLAAVYDYGRKGTEGIPPWPWPGPDEWDKPDALSNAKRSMFFHNLCDTVSELGPDTEGWLRTILGVVEENVAEWAGGQSPNLKEEPIAKAESETNYDAIVRWAKNNRWIKYVILGFILLFAIGTAVEKFEIIAAVYDNFAGQQGKDQIHMERAEDVKTVHSLATMDVYKPLAAQKKKELIGKLQALLGQYTSFTHTVTILCPAGNLSRVKVGFSLKQYLEEAGFEVEAPPVTVGYREIPPNISIKSHPDDEEFVRQFVNAISPLYIEEMWDGDARETISRGSFRIEINGDPLFTELGVVKFR